MKSSQAKLVTNHPQTITVVWAASLILSTKNLSPKIVINLPRLLITIRNQPMICLPRPARKLKTQTIHPRIQSMEKETRDQLVDNLLDLLNDLKDAVLQVEIMTVWVWEVTFQEVLQNVAPTVGQLPHLDICKRLRHILLKVEMQEWQKPLTRPIAGVLGMECQTEEEKVHPTQDLLGMTRRDLTVELECQHLEEVDLPVEQLPLLLDHAEGSKSSRMDKYQEATLPMP